MTEFNCHWIRSIRWRRTMLISLVVCSMVGFCFLSFQRPNISPTLDRSSARKDTDDKNLARPVLTSANNSTFVKSKHLSSQSSSNFKPQVKTKDWFTAKIKRLFCRKVTPSTLLLENPYFHPPPTKRYEMKGELIISSTRCSDTTEMVLLVLSCPDHVGTRQVIRETWGSVAKLGTWPWVNFTMDIRLFFVLGVQNHSDFGKYASGKVDNSHQGNSESDGYFASISNSLHNEAAEFDDILQLDTIEGYANLTRKMILGLEWIGANCPKAKYVVKADQDIFVNIPLIWTFLENNTYNNSIFGHIYFNGYVMRSGRWGVPEPVLPIDRYPAYASGTAYILSMDAISKIVHTYSMFPYVQIEDAFITGIVASAADVYRYHVRGFTSWARSRPDPCEIVMDRVLAANKVTEKEHMGIWKEVVGQGQGRCI